MSKKYTTKDGKKIIVYHQRFDITKLATKIVEKDKKKVKRAKRKREIKKQIEEMFSVKVEKVNTLVKNNKKYAYIKLKQDYPAIDVATKLGLI